MRVLFAGLRVLMPGVGQPSALKLVVSLEECDPGELVSYLYQNLQGIDAAAQVEWDTLIQA